MKSYYYIAKIRFVSQLAYRFDVIVVFLSNVIMLMAQVFLWRCVYSGKGVVAGVNESQMVTYAVFSTLMGLLMHTTVQEIIVHKVVTGEIAIDFLKPVNPLLNWMGDDIGTNASIFCLNAVPLALVSVLFVKAAPQFSAISLLLLFPAVALSFAILWAMYAVIGLLAFWFMELGNLGLVQGQVIRILAGSYIPLWFFPDWVQNISRYLPFQYIAQFPLSICIGKLSNAEIINGLAVQSIWLAVMSVSAYYIWKKAQKHVLVQGG
ncbi:MAG: ABC-2 family transporter protein [Elusimicrobiota bacterium]